MKRGRPQTTELSPAQTEVMELAALGKTQVEMAMILHIPEMAAKSRFQAAKKKLGACNKTLAVARYLERK
jgi:DNA-binding CsgD family transcriptional regulator